MERVADGVSEAGAASDVGLEMCAVAASVKVRTLERVEDRVSRRKCDGTPARLFFRSPPECVRLEEADASSPAPPSASSIRKNDGELERGGVGRRVCGEPAASAECFSCGSSGGEAHCELRRLCGKLVVVVVVLEGARLPLTSAWCRAATAGLCPWRACCCNRSFSSGARDCSCMYGCARAGGAVVVLVVLVLVSGAWKESRT